MYDLETKLNKINNGIGIVAIQMISNIVSSGNYIPSSLSEQIPRLIPGSKVIELEPNIMISMKCDGENFILTYNKDTGEFER